MKYLEIQSDPRLLRSEPHLLVAAVLGAVRLVGLTAILALPGLLTGACSHHGAVPGTGPASGSGGTIELLAVQTAAAGTLIPISGEENAFTLTLEGVNPQVVVFSDRPQRVTATITIDRSIELFWSEDTPPNVALVASVHGEQHVLSLELSSPRHEKKNGTITYTAKPLLDLSAGLGHLRDDLVADVPRAFTTAAIFIDSGCTPDASLGSCGDVG